MRDYEVICKATFASRSGCHIRARNEVTNLPRIMGICASDTASKEAMYQGLVRRKRKLRNPCAHLQKEAGRATVPSLVPANAPSTAVCLHNHGPLTVTFLDVICNRGLRYIVRQYLVACRRIVCGGHMAELEDLELW